MTDISKKITASIAKLKSPQKEIATALRVLLKKALPGAPEDFKWRMPFFGHATSIMPTGDHVNLQLMYGAKLADPEKVLEGTGNTMRHVKLWKPQDMKRLAATLTTLAKQNESICRAAKKAATKPKKMVKKSQK